MKSNSNYYCALETIGRLLETVQDGLPEDLPLSQVISVLSEGDTFEQPSPSEGKSSSETNNVSMSSDREAGGEDLERIRLCGKES